MTRATHADAAGTLRYSGRVVALTGAAQGLGLAMAERFAAEGAHLALADMRGPEVEEVAKRLSAVTGRASMACHTDVADPGQVEAWVDRVIAEFGKVDVLINNAGVIRDGRLEHLSNDDWSAVVDVSLTGAFYCARAVLPAMKQAQYGRILSFSSMSWRGNYGQANYVAAKAGVVGLARGIALENARYGITSNVIAPGLIETPMLASMNAAARTKLVARVPMGHTGAPVDIASAAAYLCSTEAGYITGVVLDVDGGISIGSSMR